MHKHVLGVIGYPMTHTLSPYLHGFMIEKLGLPASYFAFSVQPERLGDALAGAKALGLTGLNVTVPHKQAVMAHLDEIDARAKAIGAVNTIRFEKGAAFGTNTDAGGFLESLTFNDVSLAGR
ncbi:shikimate dehydrogenase, partial [candidate division KSB1 bacterium]|nr:shikimate dehydrogenase [candidate division KSB1 bacterium]